MWVDERRTAMAAALFAIVGTALLLFLAEKPGDATVARALVSPPNSLLKMTGTVQNVTADRFLLCQDFVCISVRKGEIASAELVAAGRESSVTGRVKEYQGRKYLEAELVETK